MPEEKEKPYVQVKVPTELIAEVDGMIGNKGYVSRMEFVRDAIRDLLRHYEREKQLASKSHE